MMWNWIKLIGIVILIVLIAKFVNNSEPFCNYGRDGKNCGNVDLAYQVCGELASANCRIPSTQMNDCWLDTYRNCKQKCGSMKSNCNCYDEASESCGSGNEPAIACYADLQQKCMAGLGLAPDPDRGMPFGHIVN